MKFAIASDLTRIWIEGYLSISHPLLNQSSHVWLGGFSGVTLTPLGLSNNIIRRLAIRSHAGTITGQVDMYGKDYHPS